MPVPSPLAQLKSLNLSQYMKFHTVYPKHKKPASNANSTQVKNLLGRKNKLMPFLKVIGKVEEHGRR